MVTFIKNFIYVWKILKTGVHTVGFYKVMESIMKFANDVKINGKPMMTKIAVMDLNTGQEMFDVVSLWAGCGDANPIERIGHLRSQNNAMKELLEKCRSNPELGKDNDLIININLALKYFE